MNKIIIAVIIGIFHTATYGLSYDKTWYTGIKVGQSYFNNTDFTLNDGNSIISNMKSTFNQLGTSVFIGYKHKMFGFEVGYDSFGKLIYYGNEFNGNVKTQGIQITARINYPITKTLNLYTRLGGMLWHKNINGIISQNLNHYKLHSNGVSPVYVLGLEYNINNTWATRLDYQWIIDIGNDNSLSPMKLDNKMLTLDLVYHFVSNSNKKPKIIPAPILKSPSKLKKVVCCIAQ